MFEQFGNDYNGVKRLLETQKREGQGGKHSGWQMGKLILDTLWINFSQKHDFNPPHSHSGSLSFVIFCKVPQKIFEVQADSNSQVGELHFTYGEQISELQGWVAN